MKPSTSHCPGFRESKDDTRAKATEDLAFDELHYAPHEDLGMEVMAHLKMI